MTTGSVVSGALIPGLPGGSYGTRSERNWNGADRASSSQSRSPASTRVVFGPPSLFGLRGASADLLSEVSSDGIPLMKHTIRVPSKGSLTKREKNAWHFYTTTRFKYTNVTFAEYKISNGAYAGGPYVQGCADDADWTAWSPLPFFGANETNALLSDIYSEVKGSEFNPALFLAQGNQTLAMIGGTAVKLAKSIHHLRRGDVASAARSLTSGTNRAPIKPPKGGWKALTDTSVKNLSSAWLELQYGWLPLLQDVDAGAKAIAHQLTPPTRFSVVKTKTKTQTTISQSYQAFTPVKKVTEDLRIEYLASENLDNIALLGLNDPLTVAWELVPFSFVVDWFLPIGDYLEARCAVSSLKGTYRMTQRYRVKTDLVNRPNGNGVVVRAEEGPYPGRASYEGLSLTRSAEAPITRAAFPRFKPLNQAASVKHCLNAIALLAGAVPPVR